MLRELLFRIIREYKIRRNPVTYARSIGVRIGEDCSIVGLTPATFGTEPYLVTLGDHVELSYGVTCITHDGAAWVLRSELPHIDIINPIAIGNNVFVGARCIILPGTRIGNNCVIGAGSVVKGEIPEGSVVAGTPARVIGSFSGYREKAMKRGVDTKQMLPHEKRRYLESRFASRH